MYSATMVTKLAKPSFFDEISLITNFSLEISWISREPPLSLFPLGCQNHMLCSTQWKLDFPQHGAALPSQLGSSCRPLFCSFILEGISFSYSQLKSPQWLLPSEVTSHAPKHFSWLRQHSHALLKGQNEGHTNPHRSYEWWPSSAGTRRW